jgi:hypothetical protein
MAWKIVAKGSDFTEWMGEDWHLKDSLWYYIDDDSVVAFFSKKEALDTFKLKVTRKVQSGVYNVEVI